ncbi:hypothetical protein L6164_010108 [Bauhinia variegata]|uniref:Uncharacterized protein n=1 Tax=Bauhinia variegata TaxID=167791 RepID=A0ACB9PLU2_BAUVA|nr:hypothetical protein L6164_010108 [Bauhinia variegata]
MAELPNSRLQSMLQAAVQSVQWTYSLFWQFCPQQGILVWADGYYNGAIKTRKTVQPMEVSADEASLQRSQQLRDLYETLSAGETNLPARRPSAALSPEDLTESEWFYLMCVSFSFPSGVGLPGKAYARRQHIWLAGANELDSKVFSRAILAKSAGIQTVVCIPLLDGVVELGSTDKIQEDLNFIQHIKTFFADHHQHQQPHPPPPKPALSEHSTSNPNHSRFHSPPIPATLYHEVADPPPPAASPTAINPNHDGMDEDEEEEEEEEEEADSDSEAETVRNTAAAAEPSELMQLEMSEDIRVGSPDDGSNNLDSDFHMLAVGQSESLDHQRRADSYMAESTRRWTSVQLQEPVPLLSSGLQIQLPVSVAEDLTQEDTHYSQTVSAILQNQSTRWAESPTEGYCSSQSAFAKWNTHADHNLHVSTDGTSQWLLKYILFSVPFLHIKYRDDNSPRSGDAAARLRGKGMPQDELSANHVLAERRRREKLNERFIILRSLVPFVTKMDKASILGDTIEYVKQLRKRIQDLEARNSQMESDQRSRSGELQRTTSSKEQRSGVTVMDQARDSATGSDKKKLRTGEAMTKSPTPSPLAAEGATSVQVSIIERNALLELECPQREGLLLDVMQALREMRIEVTTVQSSLNGMMFVAELRAKVKEHANGGKKVSIVEVKRALNQIIPHTD